MDSLRIQPEHDSFYYFHTLTFMVEGVLFKVPRLYFEKNSSVFRNMFALPVTDDNQREGSYDERPINLGSIQKVDFQRLLAAMFPDLSRYSPNPMTMGHEEWTSVLKLSTLWIFRELRDKALDELAHIGMDPVEKVLLSREYRVESWLIEGYAELVKRDVGPSSEESKRLGYETALKIYQRRERTFLRGVRPMHGPSSGFGRAAVNSLRGFDDLEIDIRHIFREELKDVRYETVVDEADEVSEAEIERPTTIAKRRYLRT